VPECSPLSYRVSDFYLRWRLAASFPSLIRFKRLVVTLASADQRGQAPPLMRAHHRPARVASTVVRVDWGLAGAFAAAVAYGAATILQAIGARAGGDANELDVRLVRRLLRSSPYILGLLLDAVGFGLSFAALHTLPLFTVEAVVASSLAVTALLAVVMLDMRPSMIEWLALICVTAGLTLLASSAKAQAPVRLDDLDQSLLVISVGIVGAIVVVAARRRRTPNRGDSWALGIMAGLMYGAAGIGARILRTPSTPWRLFLDPALYAMALAGILGLLLYAMALQRGSVTVATSAVVVAETLMPAAIGIGLLGDRPAHGRDTIAALGFALTVAGAVALARYGEPPARNVERTAGVPVGTLPAP
jgi:drug/metabolite transporter (DMT)-like permease